MFEILIPILIFSGIFFFVEDSVLTNHNYLSGALINIVTSAIFLVLDIWAYFYPDRFRIFWTRFYKSYRETFAKTKELYSKRLLKISMATLISFIAANLLLTYYHLAMCFGFTVLIALSISAFSNIFIFKHASSEERREYFNIQKEEPTAGRRSAMKWILGIFAVEAFSFYASQSSYREMAMCFGFTIFVILYIGTVYRLELFINASSEERREYFNFLKSECTMFSKSGLSCIAGIFIIGAIWLYNLQYGDEGTFCFVDAGNYESVMKGSFEKINSVKVRKNSLTEQQIIEVLKKCDPEKLQNLELDDVKLSDDFWKTAQKFHKLTRLDFWNVDISKLPESFAESFTCMENLFIYGSKNLEEFPNGIEKLQKLQRVTLDGCGLKKLPKNIGKLKNLKQLSLAENPLESVDDVCSLRNLIMLDVGDCKLKNLPQNIINLKNLEALNISDNEFTEFPKQIRELTTLVRLDAAGLNLKSVPQEIFELKNLSNLSLNRNQLESLPNEISNLKDLTHLYLGENKFKTVPPQLLKISRLRSLSLKGNQLSELPSEMESLITKLSWFDISHNKFRTRPTLLQKFRGEYYCLMEEDNPYNKKKESTNKK